MQSNCVICLLFKQMVGRFQKIEMCAAESNRLHRNRNYLFIFGFLFSVFLTIHGRNQTFEAHVHHLKRLEMFRMPFFIQNNRMESARRAPPLVANVTYIFLSHLASFRKGKTKKKKRKKKWNLRKMCRIL